MRCRVPPVGSRNTAAQQRRRRVPMLRQRCRRDQLPGLKRGSHDDDGPESAGKDCGEAVNGKGRRDGSQGNATTKVANLTDVVRRPIALGTGTPVTPTGSVSAGVSSVTAGVTDDVAMIASALRRIRPATSHDFNRRPVRILFQPHWRPSSAALAVTRPSGCEEPGQRLPVIEWTGRNGFGHDETLLSYPASAMRGAPPGCTLRRTTSRSRKGGAPGTR